MIKLADNNTADVCLEADEMTVNAMSYRWLCMSSTQQSEGDHLNSHNGFQHSGTGFAVRISKGILAG